MPPYLKSVPAVRKRIEPAAYKITLWLKPDIYWQFMARSAAMASGKISVNKYFRQAFGLVEKKEQKKPRSLTIPEITRALSSRSTRITRALPAAAKTRRRRAA